MEDKVKSSQLKKKQKAMTMIQKALTELNAAYAEAADKTIGDVICTLRTAERELNSQL